MPSTDYINLLQKVLPPEQKVTQIQNYWNQNAL